MTQKVGRTIGFTTEEGPKWAFVILDKEHEATFDAHIKDDGLDIAKKGDELTVEFNDAVIGRIIHVQDHKFTEEQKNELCLENGLITGVGDELDEAAEDDIAEDTEQPRTGESYDGPGEGPG